MKHTQYKFIALTTEDNIEALRHYLNAHGAEGWNVWIMKPEDAREAKLSATPITVVLGDNGDAEKVWVGDVAFQRNFGSRKVFWH